MVTICVFLIFKKNKELKKQLNEFNMDYKEYMEQRKNDALVKLIRRSIGSRMERMRELSSDEEFEEFVELFIKTSIPANTWKRNCQNLRLSSYVTVAVEAFVLVTLENSVREWVEIATTEKEKRIKGQYTKYTGKKSEKNKNGRIRGWSVAGKRRYSNIFFSLKAYRKTEESVRMEKDLLIRLKAKNAEFKHNEKDEELTEEEMKQRKKDREFKVVSGFDASDDDEER